LESLEAETQVELPGQVQEMVENSSDNSSLEEITPAENVPEEGALVPVEVPVKNVIIPPTPPVEEEEEDLDDGLY